MWRPEIGRAYPGTGRDATGRASAAPAIRREDVRPFDPRNAAAGGGGSSGGEVQVKAHARDGGETPVKAHTRSAPGTGGSAKNSDHPGAAWSGLFPGEGGSHHHDRNKNQTCPPQAPANDPNWHDYGSSGTHCGHNDYRGKTRGPTSGHQCVYDDDGNLVTDPQCQGTYDYAPPYNPDNRMMPRRLKDHIKKDVFPWLLYGN
jgi:hypothetical protein